VEKNISYDDLKKQWAWTIDIQPTLRFMLQLALGASAPKLQAKGYGNLQDILNLAGNTMISVKSQVQEAQDQDIQPAQPVQPLAVSLGGLFQALFINKEK
jgi:hypothetical protein